MNDTIPREEVERAIGEMIDAVRMWLDGMNTKKRRIIIRAYGSASAYTQTYVDIVMAVAAGEEGRLKEIKRKFLDDTLPDIEALNRAVQSGEITEADLAGVRQTKEGEENMTTISLRRAT